MAVSPLLHPICQNSFCVVVFLTFRFPWKTVLGLHALADAMEYEETALAFTLFPSTLPCQFPSGALPISFLLAFPTSRTGWDLACVSLHKGWQS